MTVADRGDDHRDAEQTDEDGGRERGLLQEPVEPWRPVGCITNSHGRRDADGNERHRQANTECGNQREAKGHLLELKAQQKHRDRGGTGYQPAGKAEQDGLQRRCPAILHPGLDLASMCHRVSIRLRDVAGMPVTGAPPMGMSVKMIMPMRGRMMRGHSGRNGMVPVNGLM